MTIDKQEAKRLYDASKEKFIKNILELAKKKSTDAVFTDVIKMQAIAYHNAVLKDEALEQEYLDIVKQYTREELDLVIEAGCSIIEGLEHKFGDFLGECFEEIGANNGSKGQFFTPYHVSKILAEVCINIDDAKQTIKDHGYMVLNDCACGGGSTLIGGLDVLKDHGINFQTQCLVVAEDIDERCFWMSFLHFAVIGAPALVYHKNTLTQETWKVLATPMYYINHWRFNGCQERIKEHNEELHDKTEDVVVEPKKEPQKGQLSLF